MYQVTEHRDDAGRTVGYYTNKPWAHGDTGAHVYKWVGYDYGGYQACLRRVHRRYLEHRRYLKHKGVAEARVDVPQTYHICFWPGEPKMCAWSSGR